MQWQDAEEAQIREVRQDGSMEEGESVVHLRRPRRRWPWLLLSLLLLPLLLLPREEEKKSPVSLPQAALVLQKKEKYWNSFSVSRTLQKNGFLVSPDMTPEGPEISVESQNGVVILRSSSDTLQVRPRETKRRTGE